MWHRAWRTCSLLLLSGCQLEANLDVLLVGDCDQQGTFAGLRSFRISLIGDAGWNDQIELLGCIRRSVCFTEQVDFEPPLVDLEALRRVAAERDVLFRTSPGANQAIVLAGFDQPDCKPRQDAPRIPICGFHVSSVPDDDATFHLLVACSGAPKICWGTQFMDACP